MAPSVPTASSGRTSTPELLARGATDGVLVGLALGEARGRGAPSPGQVRVVVRPPDEQKTVRGLDHERDRPLQAPSSSRRRPDLRAQLVELPLDRRIRSSSPPGGAAAAGCGASVARRAAAARSCSVAPDVGGRRRLACAAGRRRDGRRGAAEGRGGTRASSGRPAPLRGRSSLLLGVAAARSAPRAVRPAVRRSTRSRRSALPAFRPGRYMSAKEWRRSVRVFSSPASAVRAASARPGPPCRRRSARARGRASAGISSSAG